MNRLLWKLIPKTQRELLLERLPVIDRQVVNKTLSGKNRFPAEFDALECVFIHVPKCAGSSVAMALFGSTPTGHMPLYWYEKQFNERFQHYFKFGFVRDPLQRAWSAYSYLLNNTQDRDKAAQALVSRYDSFDDFVSHWLRPENITKQIHFTPQHYFLQDAMGHLNVDFIGRQETLQEDFRKLCIHLHVKAELPHINRSSAADNQFIQFCSPATRRRVREVYARDYELFAYD
ncbi:MAG: sulfotransferase family 2 domain-containing protein [Pseudomonas sp.]|jgi:hypothetical protein